jgi:hypothetical protein
MHFARCMLLKCLSWSNLLWAGLVIPTGYILTDVNTTMYLFRAQATSKAGLHEYVVPCRLPYKAHLSADPRSQTPDSRPQHRSVPTPGYQEWVGVLAPGLKEGQSSDD